MPAELPLVTLGLPVHNGGAHLEQALRALQGADLAAPSRS
jgi:hypothetical protein